MSSAHRWSWSRRAQPGQRHVRPLPTARTGMTAIVVEGDDRRCTVQGSATWRAFSNAYDEWEDRPAAMAAVETVLGTAVQWTQIGPHTWAASVPGATPGAGRPCAALG
ncbi:MAG TPA: hypothetical protein VMB72_11450 [Acidimicrobiales bacterium]|nr:hypothetical protein [Acidimicrobiales bacterium]